MSAAKDKALSINWELKFLSKKQMNWLRPWWKRVRPIPLWFGIFPHYLTTHSEEQELHRNSPVLLWYGQLILLSSYCHVDVTKTSSSSKLLQLCDILAASPMQLVKVPLWEVVFRSEPREGENHKSKWKHRGQNVIWNSNGYPHNGNTFLCLHST